MSATGIVHPTPHPPLPRELATRVLALAVLLGVPVVVGFLAMDPAIHPTTDLLTAYSPARLAQGHVWTLPLSALIAARPAAVGTNVIVPAIVLVPYVLGWGWRRPAIAFGVGHVVATLAAAVVISIGAAAGWDVAIHLFHVTDSGVSAGLAAAGGGLAVALWRTPLRPLAFVVVVVLVGVFTRRIAVENTSRLLADCEHLVAMSTGAMIERRAVNAR